jgi:demethylmenaquinone methyltransferase/2-methoxy-6-polyprenyl-1,4-benzoquinol methylase
MPTTPAQPAWTDELLHDPHAAADKRSRVQRMFAAIADSYDLNNRLHSLGRDQAWRRKAVRLATLKPDDVVVDVACGTGDLTLAFADALLRARSAPLRPGQVVGIDYTFQMLPPAVAKSRERAAMPGIAYLNGDATALPLPDACCDVVSIAFGIRNVQEPERALLEFRRVLRPGGRVIVLEFSEPTFAPLRVLNRFYTHHVMPRTATWISGDRSGAYRYLPKSIGTFWSRDKMTDMLHAAGFDDVSQHPMTFGVCVCYRGLVRG